MWGRQLRPPTWPPPSHLPPPGPTPLWPECRPSQTLLPTASPGPLAVFRTDTRKLRSWPSPTSSRSHSPWVCSVGAPSPHGDFPPPTVEELGLILLKKLVCFLLGSSGGEGRGRCCPPSHSPSLWTPSQCSSVGPLGSWGSTWTGLVGAQPLGAHPGLGPPGNGPCQAGLQGQPGRPSQPLLRARLWLTSRSCASGFRLLPGASARH